MDLVSQAAIVVSAMAVARAGLHAWPRVVAIAATGITLIALLPPVSLEQSLTWRRPLGRCAPPRGHTAGAASGGEVTPTAPASCLVPATPPPNGSS